MSITEKWRIWIYYRLSRDEDSEMNSLKNQRSILMDYIEEHGYIYVGESFDDNVSGMTFDVMELRKSMKQPPNIRWMLYWLKTCQDLEDIIPKLQYLLTILQNRASG